MYLLKSRVLFDLTSIFGFGLHKLDELVFYSRHCYLTKQLDHYYTLQGLGIEKYEPLALLYVFFFYSTISHNNLPHPIVLDQLASKPTKESSTERINFVQPRNTLAILMCRSLILEKPRETDNSLTEGHQLNMNTRNGTNWFCDEI